jgi:hypothetical protein
VAQQQDTIERARFGIVKGLTQALIRRVQQDGTWHSLVQSRGQGREALRAV